MSGRKSCEVAAVLKQGESIRQLTDGIYSQEIADCYGRYRTILEDMTSIKRSADSTSANLDSSAQEMFGTDGKRLLQEFNRIKKAMSEQVIEDKGKFVSDELTQLDRKLRAADTQAEKIRDSIRHKNWYCDTEYAQAQELVRTYNSLRSERVNLERRIKNLLSDAGQKVSSMRSEYSRMKNLAEQMTSMNVTAKKRKEADAFRKELRNALGAIDKQNAEKFFVADFDSLSKSTSKFLALNDEAVLSSFQKQYAAITEFQVQLTERVALWHKQKDDAQALFEQMEHTAAENFVDPIDRYNGMENGQRINLFDYLKIFSGNDLKGKYSQLYMEASNLIRQEKFLDSMTIIKLAIDLAESARQEALNLQETMLKKIELAGAIQDVMDELRYDTDLQIINDNPNDGFKITCNIGDEIIDFRHVDIDKDGKIVVDIDHTEGKGSNCSGAWKDISKRLNEVGIPLTEVRMANGASVLHQGGTVSSSSGQLTATH